MPNHIVLPCRSWDQILIKEPQLDGNYMHILCIVSLQKRIDLPHISCQLKRKKNWREKDKKQHIAMTFSESKVNQELIMIPLLRATNNDYYYYQQPIIINGSWGKKKKLFYCKSKILRQQLIHVYMCSSNQRDCNLTNIGGGIWDNSEIWGEVLLLRY